MRKFSWTRSSSIAIATLGLLTTMVSLAATQEQASQRTAETAEPNGDTLLLPGSDRVLEMRVNVPQQVRIGDEFDYEIRIRNLTANMVLHDVKIVQHNGDGLRIHSSKTRAVGQNASRNGDRHQPRKADRKADEDSDKAGSENRDGNADGQDHSDKNDQDSNPNDRQKSSRQKDDSPRSEKNDSGEWTISKLEPGEERRIQVTATNDTEGSDRTCIAIESFTPALCLKTDFVKPEIELVKKAPDKVNLCNPIRFEYFVRNTGSGATGPFRIQDKLEDGLQTASGDDSLDFPVENVKPGETKKFIADIRATKAGEFSSRAVAKQQEQGQTRSNSTTTHVLSADLAVTIDGPETTYYDRPATYTIRVTNRGEAPAEATRLDFYAADSAQLMRAGDPRPSEKPASDAAESDSTKVVDRLARDSGDGAQDTASRKREPKGQRMHSWELGTLESGQTQSVNVTLRSREAGTFNPTAVATSACSADKSQVARAANLMETEIISVPALMIAVVDQVDPVSVGDEVVYNIVLQNQGTAPDRDLKITAMMPDELEFERAAGATEAESDGQEITFQPIKELPAGKRVSWNVRAKVKEAGDVRFEVNLTSEHQEKEVTSEEPTRLIKTSN